MTNKTTVIYTNMWSGLEIIKHSTGTRKFTVWDKDNSKEICVCNSEENALKIVKAIVKSIFA